MEQELRISNPSLRYKVAGKVISVLKEYYKPDKEIW
ncbi:Protein of unknown function [Pyronema omphalodes CBS 100304]|uniref:Uncharacterized protein n=1 Tax=Pyronema omphalodes (strain CBS 100304) TaxID=1076935 RepID=U4LGX4_PYROM|nr:Protein of unknown function [Pyronema omphalodes CBS 100304]